MSDGRRVADIAASEVEAIVAAAQGVTDRLRKEATVEADTIREDARAEARRMREEAVVAAGRVRHEAEARVNSMLLDARRQADEQLAEARQQVDSELADVAGRAERLTADAESEALRIREEAEAESGRLLREARHEAEDRVTNSQKAADEALAEARAVSAGLRQLAHTLQAQAETILRDVQTGHRRIAASLQVATGISDPDRATWRAGRSSDRLASELHALEEPPLRPTRRRPRADLAHHEPARRPGLGLFDADRELDAPEPDRSGESSHEFDRFGSETAGSSDATSDATNEIDVPDWIVR